MDNALDMNRVRDEILLAALPNIAFDGWTRQAMRAGASAAGYQQAVLDRAFPNGIGDLLEHFNAWTDSRMVERLGDHDLTLMSVAERIGLALRLRLEAMAPHREAVRRAAAYFTLPTNGILGWRLLYASVDTVWYGIGDQSTDFTYYTKRALLAPIMTTATCYWLADESEGFRDTNAFIDRSLRNAFAAQGVVDQLRGLGDMVQYFPSPFRFVRQVRRRAQGV